MDLHHAGVYNLVIYVVGFNQSSTTIPFTYSVTHQHPILFGQTQCVGFEPTRRINARPDSNRLQFHYGNTAEFSCIVKNIRKEAAETFLAGVMPAGGFEPPFCYHAYSDYFKWKVPESNRPHGLLVHLTVIASLRYTFPCAFPCSASEVEHGVFYLRRASASYLLVGSYPTTWGREESNLYCLPLGN